MKRSSSFWEEADDPGDDEDERKLIEKNSEIRDKVESLKEEAKTSH